MITVGSLFSGIGGIELGLERTRGFKTIWFVENNPYCQAILRKHWPNMPIYEDIKQLDFGKLERPDMLTGGFPCQPVSAIGKRKGREDERWLWPNYANAICALRPKLILVENVPNILAFTWEFGRVLGNLAEFGYDAEWQVLNSKQFGVPQSRRRVFIVAHSRDLCGHEIFCASKETDQHPKMDEEVQHAPTLTASYSADSYGSGRPYIVGGDVVWIDQKSCPELEARTPKSSCQPDQNSGSLEKGDTGSIGENSRLMLLTQEKNSRFSLTPAFGMDAQNTSNSPKPTQSFGKIRLKGTREETLKLQQLLKERGGKSLGFGNMTLRALTLTECEGIMGFPIGWTVGIKDKERYKCLGNAVVPQVAEAIGHMILKVESHD